ncbi:cell division protein FtsI [Desulfallas sp. Bu1-1]|uniref:peptidoglycan D,D-transpeptidase FtsI family protein n=1 Tax=Desulfallas sp. Bu1-1 TaxID=2787620 RepID=UPI00189DFFFF|nr:penicillin-binding transpeptidase domain-containing protein [Desulfallas sp. Bu1-1]MBF7082336.1 cell division protein FtsI [Desulfallas sp. Bu1-1]
MKANVRRLAYFILAGLAAICLYLAAIPPYIAHITGTGTGPVDPRVSARENIIKRGDILDRNGRVLARSVPAERGYTREYPLGAAAAHIIGYYSSRYGSAGLEKSQAPVLLGLENDNKLSNLFNRILGQPATGNNVILTIDADLQQFTAGLLRGKKGAAVAINPATGEVLAMASYPDYDPNRVTDYLNRAGSPLLNRAAQGAYPPGSVFKIVTAAGVLAGAPGITEKTINCTGRLAVGGFTLRDYAAHGMVDFQDAFAKSCNVAFGRYGLALGPQKLTRVAREFGVGVKPDFPLPVYEGSIPPAGKMDDPAVASTAIGQGEILISPLQAALLACAVANDGVIMKPYLVAGYYSPEGGGRKYKPEVWLRAMDPAVAGVLKEAMIAVVREGTGRSAALPGVTVAGKTGSAENPHGEPHAWFVAFAPAEAPRVAVAVLVENAGSGGANAAPIAREIIRRALDRL